MSSSNLSGMKSMIKPLKGGSVYSNIGVFENLTTTTLTIDSINVEGLLEDGVLINVLIRDSSISSTTIGLDGPAAASFTTVQTQGDVTFLSVDPSKYVEWDVNTGIFKITSDLQVNGCSKLGNLEICNNNITATNFNGDVNIIPNNLGTVYLKGPVFNDISSGNFFSNAKSGTSSLGGANGVTLFSTSGTGTISTFSSQNFSTINGDISLTTDSGISNKIITTISPTNGNIIVTTSLNHDLKNGDIINIASTPASLLNTSWAVGSIISSKSFLLNTTTTIGTTYTGGTLSRQNTSNINLNATSLVKIPSNVKLTFGQTCNSVSANTNGSLLVQSCNDIYLSSGNTYIPSQSKLNFSSTGNWIQYDTALNMFGSSGINLTAPTVQILSTNTRFYDPIITVGDYNPPVNDVKDRGVEFYYYSTTGSTKLGWFGYKTNTGKFTFLTNVTNTNETVTGSIGNFEIGDITTTQLTISGGGGLNMNCSEIFNTSVIRGCNNNLTLDGASNVNLTANNRISLNALTDVLIPNNTILKFGTNGSYINESTIGNLNISGLNNIRFYTSSRGSIIVPVETFISFDGSSIGSQRISSNTTGDLLINSNRSIFLTTTGGNIIVPQLTQVHLGNSSQNVSGSSSGIRLLTTSNDSSFVVISNSNVNISSSFGNIVLSPISGDVNLYPTNGNVRIPAEKFLIFGTSGTTNSIVNSSGTILITGNSSNTLRISNINTIDLLANSSVNIPINTRLNFGTDGQKYIYSDNSQGLILTNTNTAGNLSIVSRILNINDTNTNITSTNLTIVGGVTQINSDNTRFKDPIITIADYNSSSSDLLDRGIEYKYYSTTGSLMKLGWFGRKDVSNRFTFYSDAINTGEIITGTIGDLEVSSAYIRNNLNFVNSGSIDLSCGTIANVNTIIGCSGVINIRSDNSINITTGNFDINASSRIRVPTNIPITFGTSTTNMSSDSAGNLYLNSLEKIILNANVQVNGTTSNVYSTVTNVQDPIISIGGITGTIINDLKDRGIEFKWSDGLTSKVGFFGYKNNLGKFVFIKDGINNNEIFSGNYGDVKFGEGDFNNIYLNNGNLTGISQISGGQITIKSTSGNISIQPTTGSSVLIPSNIPISFGDSTNSIFVNTSGILNINSNTGVQFKEQVPIYIGNNAYIIKDTSNNVVLNNSNGSILLTPGYSTGNVTIPANTYLGFGSTENSVTSIDNKLVLMGYNGISLNSSTVTIAGDLNIIGSVTSTATDFDINKYILPLGTYQLLNVNSITNWTGGNGNVKIGVTSTHYFSVGDTVTLRNSNSIPKIDDTYVIKSIVSGTEFVVTSINTVLAPGTSGTIKSNIMLPQGKDVGIEVDYWSTTGNINVTSGSVGFKRGFFGFKSNTETWSFYKQATINNNVVTGDLGDIVVNKVNTSRISGFGLDGTMSAGSNLITGTNFQIGGGSINNVPIGASVGSTGRFTTLTNTVSASLSGVSLDSSLVYSRERYTLSSTGLQTRSPSMNVIVSMFSVSGVNWTTSSGTMPSLSVSDGTLKTIICSSMGEGCIHTLFFGEGKLIAPNSLANTPQPTRLIFKRRGQSVNLIFDSVLAAWVILGTGAYVN